MNGDGSASTKSTRRRVVDDTLNCLYGGRPIRFRSAGFRVESMHHTKNFLADGFDGAVRPRRVNGGETVLDSKRDSQVLHNLVAEVRTLVGEPLRTGTKVEKYSIRTFDVVSASAFLHGFRKT